MDNIKELISLPMSELLARTTCRKNWKRISVESSIIPPPTPPNNLSDQGTELNCKCIYSDECVFEGNVEKSQIFYSETSEGSHRPPNSRSLSILLPRHQTIQFGSVQSLDPLGHQRDMTDDSPEITSSLVCSRPLWAVLAWAWMSPL